MVNLPDHLAAKPAGRRRLPDAVMASHQREHILDAAAEVFAKRGYRATTVDHLVAAARIGVGSFYEHFEGKEDCFLAAYDRIVAGGRERIAAAILPDAPWPEQVCAALRTLLELIAAQPLAARLVIVEAQTAGPAGLTRYEAVLADVAALIRRGRAFSPVSEELPQTLEDATVAGLAWLLHQRLVMGEAAGVQDVFPDLVDIVLAPYLGSEEATRLGAAGAAATPLR